MATTRAALTEADIRTLLRGSTPDERAAAAHKLCRRMDVELDEQEREAAQAVLRLMADDAAELVRRALAITLQASSLLPRDVALKLADDVDGIALPILTHSPAFTDEDLCEIVRCAPAARQVAVASRSALAPPVADALAEHGCEEAVRIACANDNADFSETGLDRAVERFRDSQAVVMAMAYRRALPLSISAKLIGLVADHVRDHLMAAHGLTPPAAEALVEGAGERAMVDLVDQAGRASDVKAFVEHLHEEAKLTPSLLLRALAHGHMTFFEWSLAALASVPHHRTWLMVHDAGALGFRAIYERAGLPAKLFTTFRAGIDTFHALQAEGELKDIAQLQERMLQRFLTQPLSAPRQDMNYLLEKLDRLRSRDAGRSAA